MLAPVIPICSARSRTEVCSNPCAQKQFIAASRTVVSSNSLGRAIIRLASAAAIVAAIFMISR